MQIDSPLSTIKLSISTLDRLGSKGRNYFIWHCRFVYYSPLYNDIGQPSSRILTLFLPIVSCSSRAANIRTCSLLLGKPAEFILDNSDSECVYLGNSDDLEKMTDSIVVRNAEDKLPTLYHRGLVQKHAHLP